jgi:hypothetical protein
MARADREQATEVQQLREAVEAWRARCADLEAQLASLQTAHLSTREYLFAPAELVAPPAPVAPQPRPIASDADRAAYAEELAAFRAARDGHDAECQRIRADLLSRTIRIRAAALPAAPAGCTFRGIAPGSEQVQGRGARAEADRIHVIEAPGGTRYRERAPSATAAAAQVAARLGVSADDLRWRGCTAA